MHNGHRCPPKAYLWPDAKTSIALDLAQWHRSRSALRDPVSHVANPNASNSIRAAEEGDASPSIELITYKKDTTAGDDLSQETPYDKEESELTRDPPSNDSGTLLSETDAKIMMDKIEARAKWLKANGKACKFQEADPECSLATFSECDKPVASEVTEIKSGHRLPRDDPDIALSKRVPCDETAAEKLRRNKANDKAATVPKWLKAKAHEVPKQTIHRWKRFLSRDPPSYDSGIPLSEAVAKTMMDKIEARSKWLQAKKQEAIYMGSKWRAILARAKIFERAWHKLSQKGTIVGDDPKAFRAIYLFPLHGESETDLRNIWAAMQRAVSKTRSSSHDYSKLKAVFQQYKDANTNWKDILLAYRADKIRDWNRHWHAIRRAMTVESHYRRQMRRQ